jgi:hypothetical protein
MLLGAFVLAGSRVRAVDNFEEAKKFSAHSGKPVLLEFVHED